MTGAERESALVECPDCENGRKWVSRHGGNDPDVWDVPCKRCDGTGKIEGDA